MPLLAVALEVLQTDARMEPKLTHDVIKVACGRLAETPVLPPALRRISERALSCHISSKDPSEKAAAAPRIIFCPRLTSLPYPSLNCSYILQSRRIPVSSSGGKNVNSCSVEAEFMSVNHKQSKTCNNLTLRPFVGHAH